MEFFAKILIYFHVFTGGIALFVGLISMASAKGSKLHKQSGLIFFFSMLISGISAMIVAVLPNHHSSFLFAVGIFSSYFILSGYRALNFKKENPNLTIDKWISRIMIITGILMIVLPIILSQSINIVLTVFGLTGILFSIKDLILFRNPTRLKQSWLKLHIGKMLGGYISATTAFVIVNNFFPSYYGWFIPSLVGGFVISYWLRKIKTTKRVKLITEF